MKNRFLFFSLLAVVLSTAEITAQDSLRITTIGHASVMLEYDNFVIHIDPITREGDYSILPDADIILITHQHSDHLDINAINYIKKEGTILVYTQTCANQIAYTDSAIIMANGDSINVKNIPVKAVPAYNPTKSQHPKGIGNGYIIRFCETTIYFAGDTEDIPEMAELGEIDIAFIPMNQPYTMNGGQAANAAKIINPDILYIYHYQSTYIATLLDLLKDEDDMEIRADDVTIKEAVKNNTGTSSLFSDGQNKNIEVIPNPVSSSFEVKIPTGSSGTIRLFDLRGRILKSLPAFQNVITDVSTVPVGTYIISFETDCFSISKKITICR